MQPKNIRTNNVVIKRFDCIITYNGMRVSKGIQNITKARIVYQMEISVIQNSCKLYIIHFQHFNYNINASIYITKYIHVERR